MNVLIGAGSQTYPGWIPTQKDELDLRSSASFAQFFQGRRASRLVCEHVWEHLTEQEGRSAARLCYDYLEEGGILRVAVPDGNFRNEEYQRIVRVGGPGPSDHPAADHKMLYTKDLLVDVFASAGFIVDPLEYCDPAGRFHFHQWDWMAGPIYRSLRTDERNRGLNLGFVSLIIDAIKPQKRQERRTDYLRKAAEPGATDNPGGAQRLREDH